MALPASVTAARSWPGFVAAVEALADTTAKGNAFEQLVAHYLRTDPIYRTKLARVWRHRVVPAGLPSNPSTTYADEGFINCPDFLHNPEPLGSTLASVS